MSAKDERRILESSPITQYLTLSKLQFNSKLQSKEAVTEYLVVDEDTHTRHWWASSPMTSWGMRSGHNEAVLCRVE